MNIEEVWFHDGGRWVGKCDCFARIEGQKGLKPITQIECYEFINSLGVKCYGENKEGYIVYGK